MSLDKVSKKGIFLTPFCWFCLWFRLIFDVRWTWWPVFMLILHENTCTCLLISDSSCFLVLYFREPSPAWLPWWVFLLSSFHPTHPGFPLFSWLPHLCFHLVMCLFTFSLILLLLSVLLTLHQCILQCTILQPFLSSLYLNVCFIEWNHYYYHYYYYYYDDDVVVVSRIYAV